MLGWVVGAVAVYVAAAILPRFDVGDFWAALLAALIIGLLTALLPPLIAAIRLPYTVASTFLLVLVVDALILRARRLAHRRRDRRRRVSPPSSPRWSSPP